MVTFAALLANIFSLVFPWFVTFFMIKLLAYAIVPDQVADFVVQSYLPELENGVKDLKVPINDKLQILAKFTGMIIKILWAFLWQEFFIPLPALYSSIPNFLGAKMTPFINAFSDLLSGFPKTDQNVVWSKNIYPGSDQCRVKSPHSLWHEESAMGLLEIVFLADFVHDVIERNNNL